MWCARQSKKTGAGIEGVDRPRQALAQLMAAAIDGHDPYWIWGIAVRLTQWGERGPCRALPSLLHKIRFEIYDSK